jgi:hypothetical protein
MKRSLTARPFVPAALSMTGFVVLCCVLLYAAVKRELVRGAVREEAQLAGIVTDATRYAMLRSDSDALRSIVQNVGSHAGVEHLRIFNKKGRITFSAASGEVGRIVDKREDGCLGCHSGPQPATSLGAMDQARQFVNERGQPVLAITAPIYNAPECIGTSCHGPEQRVLGTLDIGLSRLPFQRTLATLRWQMILFSALVLVLTVGWTAVLTRRGARGPTGE